MIKWILNKWFSLSIRDQYVDENHLKTLTYKQIKTRGKLKKLYATARLSYCIDKFIQVYGMERFQPLAIQIINEIDIEERKTMARIQVLMKQFMEAK